jgi:thiamine pyrophosphokinase
MVVVITGGDPVAASHLPDRPAGTVVIAADSGLDHAQRLGLHVDLVIGDLDSASPAALDRATQAGVPVERHPADKDATDLELALGAAIARRPRRIHVIGGHGGRLDHLLANALLLAAPAWAEAEITAQMGPARVAVVRRTTTLRGPPGGLVTLLAVGGPAGGVTTTGLRFALEEATLEPGSTRGVSNVASDDPVTVSVRSGVLIAIQPAPPRQETPT